MLSYTIIFYAIELTPKWKKNSNTRKINNCVLTRCGYTKLKIFLPMAKFLKCTPALKDTCKTSQCKKYRKLWTMDCVKFAQVWEVVLLIDPNGITKILCSKLLVTKCFISKIFYFSKELINSILVYGYFMIAWNL